MKHFMVRLPLWRLVAVVSVVLSLSACKAYKGTQDVNATGGGYEGTLTNPLVLTPATLPHAGKVDSGTSYYKITGLTATATYAVSLTHMSTNGLGISIAANSHSTGPGGGNDCYANNGWSGIGGNSCVTRANSAGEIYLSVNGAFSTGGSGGTFTLSAVTPVVNALAWNSSTFSAPGSVDTTLNWYQFNVTAPLVRDNSVYYVNITGLTDDVDVYMSDMPYINLWMPCSAKTGNTAERCRFNADINNYILGVIGNWTAAGANFTMSISVPPTLGTPTVGSTVLPVSATGTLAASDPPMDYHVQGLPASTPVLVNVSGLDAYVYPYSDKAYSIWAGTSLTPSFGMKSNFAIATATTTGDLYVSLSPLWNSVKANYTLTVKNPTTIAISFTPGATAITGTVPADNSPVLYTYTNTTAAAVTVLGATLTPGTSGDVDLIVSCANANFSSSCFNSTQMGTTVETASFGAGLSINATNGTLNVIVDTRKATPGGTFSLVVQ